MLCYLHSASRREVALEEALSFGDISAGSYASCFDSVMERDAKKSPGSSA